MSILSMILLTLAAAAVLGGTVAFITIKRHSNKKAN